MAKGPSKKRGRSGGNGEAWTGADHAIHAEERRRKQQKKLNKNHVDQDGTTHDDEEPVVSEKERRRLATTHETAEKKETLRLKLHLTKTKREVAALKEQLENWDPEEEKRKEQQRLEAQKQQEDNDNEATNQKKKYRRKGPETWKLRGAARPAWQVYDFDTRYVDPHQEEHKKAVAKAQRTQNILALYKGQLGQQGPDRARDYMGMLMQLGHLSLEAKQFKTARSAWLECMELEGDERPVTTARESLMRLYIQLGRREAALRLGGERLVRDSSVVIRYSTALVAISDKSKDMQDLVIQAIQSNPFCAFYLAFYDTFSEVMEYTEDIEDSDEEPQSSLEEAIEYCASEQVERWQGEPGTVLRNVLQQAVRGKHDEIKESHLNWEERLNSIEQEFLSRTKDATDDTELTELDTAQEVQEEKEETEQENEEEDEEETEQEEEQQAPIDVTMYAGMFRTAMEMIKEEGLL